MEASGLLKLYDFQLQTSRSLGEGIKPSPRPERQVLEIRIVALPGPGEWCLGISWHERFPDFPG